MENLNIKENIDEVNIKVLKIEKALKILKVITAIMYSLVTLFLLITFFDTVFSAYPSEDLSQSANEGVNIVLGKDFSIAMYIALVLIIIGGISYLITLIPTIIGFIISAVNIKKGVKKSNMIYFLVFTLLPVITEAVLLIASFIIKNNL